MRRLAAASSVRDVREGVVIPYLAFSTISASRQRFVFESGRVSTMRTVSPMPAVLASSWAWNLTARRTTFLYFGWLLITSTLTMIVLSPLSETTTPLRSWRRPSWDAALAVRVIALRVTGFSRTDFVRVRRSERGTCLPERGFFAGGAVVLVPDTSSAAGAASATGSVLVSDTSSAAGAASATGSVLVSDTSSAAGAASATGSVLVSDTSTAAG